MSKVIIITGASRGIGAATALQAAEQGYAVCVNYARNKDAAQSVVSAIEAKGGRAIAVAADVAVEADILRMFETVDKELGTLSALVNNAGIVAPAVQFKDLDRARIEHMFATNVTGSFLCAREAVRRMSTASGGKGGGIVNVSSRSSQLGSPGEYIDYAASKGAIDSMTIGLGKEMAMQGVRVNGVRPGLIDTDIHAPGRVDRMQGALPFGRAGTVDEVASAIMWLLSDAASYVTGTFIDVSGGR